MTDTAIYVQFSDCRQHIRKWSREPFEGGHRFMDHGCYVIWSNEHRAWWRPGRHGYTKHLADAGIYTREEANLIARNARMGSPPDMPNEIALPLADAEAQQLAVRIVYDADETVREMIRADDFRLPHWLVKFDSNVGEMRLGDNVHFAACAGSPCTCLALLRDQLDTPTDAGRDLRTTNGDKVVLSGEGWHWSSRN